MSKPRSQRPRIESPISDEVTVITPCFEGTDPETLPFLEWSDQDINSERWDSIATKAEKNPSSKTNVTLQTASGAFEDPLEVHVPPSLGAHQWKRVADIFPDASLSIFVNRSTYPDLVTPNYHLLKSEFYRSFISSVETLLYIGSTKPFPEEYGSSTGYNAQSDRPWRPWHHIYSNCKIVKGNVEHTPLYNEYGKYIVRLYWMGSWRKIYVDDLLPLDKTNAILLPSFHHPQSKLPEDSVEVKPNTHAKDKAKSGVKKEVVELWPMILCKALLKIASLSWSTRNELNDFDIINCFTGWIPQRIKTKDISSSDLWDIFMGYVERFEWNEEREGTKKTGSTMSKAKGAEKKEVTKKPTKVAIPSGIENMQEGNRYIMVTCDNFDVYTVKPDAFHRNTNVGIFISQIRDIPLVKPPPRPDLELWQKYRYEKWAVERGIIPPDIPKLNIKTLKIVDPFKRIGRSCNDMETFENRTQATLDVDLSEKKSDKSSKRTKDKVHKSRLEPDPTAWIEFDDIKDYINHVQIYFQPRGFKSKAKISDMNFQTKNTDFKHIVSPLDLKLRNEPVYLFIDSIDHKFLVLNFTQLGNILQLEKHVDEAETESLAPMYTEERDPCVEIVCKKTENELDLKDKSLSQMTNKSTVLCSFNTKLGHFVLEEYFWDTNAFGEPKGIIHTYGNKSVILNLSPGRQSFRLWVSTHGSYVLQVFSDTPMTIGNLDEYILACTAESQLLTNLCYDLSACFAKLVQSLGMPEYTISLRNFYQCYMPFGNLTKKELVTVHNALFEEFCKLVVSNSTCPNAIECVRLLFVQLKTFDYINPYAEDPHLRPDEFFSDVQINYIKIMQRAAVTVQAFFKGIYVRLLMKKLNEDHRQFSGIFDTLKRVYLDVLSSEKRTTNCPKLFRTVFERGDMEHLKEKFEIYRDMRSVVNVHVFTDSTLVLEPGWVLICRYEFHVNSLEPLPIKISLFCNLKNYSLRVFNNDTEKELKRYTNNVAVVTYDSNVYGYTILGYGWAEESIKVNWKLVLTKKKRSRADLVIVPVNPTVTIGFRDYYIPNFDNVICRYKVKVSSDALLSAHLRTSYDQVKFCIKLIDETGQIVYTSTGIGSALMPVINLRFREKSAEELMLLRKKRSTIQSTFSEITYSKLNKKSVESVTSRSGTQKKGFIETEGQDTESKRRSTLKKKVSANKAVEAGTVSERSQDSVGKSVRSKQAKTRQSEISESDSLGGERMGKRNTLKSRSFDKLNKGLPDGSRSTISSRQSSFNQFMETDQTEYILEATVLNDSWPLAAEEWQQTQQLRERSYLDLLGDKKSVARKMLNNQRINGPHSVLNLVHGQEVSLEVEQDCSKSKRFQKLKKRWFENVDRYRKGVELREAYLQENLVSNEDCLNQELVRSNNPQDFAVKIVKEPPLEEFMIKPSVEVDDYFCKIKRSEDFLIDETSIERTLREYKDDEQARCEDNEELLHRQINNFDILLQWFTEIRNDSAEMMSHAVQLEKDYVKKCLENSAKARQDNKAKDIKKKKK